jgi:hypothetical protein
MHNAPRNDEALIGQKLNRPTFEVDDELSTQHEEELIVVVVFVPVVFVLHHTKACCICSRPHLARLGSAWLRESIPLTGVEQTAMLRRGNVCN